jgi:hypothetical protein
LEAEAELRGFLPLHNYIKTLPQSSLVYDPAKAASRKVMDGEAWNVLSFRVRKLREFGTFAYGLVSPSLSIFLSLPLLFFSMNRAKIQSQIAKFLPESGQSTFNFDLSFRAQGKFFFQIGFQFWHC